jgi:hypothetical protein
MVFNEVKFRKGDERHELVLTPDARRNEKEDEKGEEGNEKGESDEDK